MAASSKNKSDVLPEIQGQVLKAAREKMRLKPEELAHRACLVKKNIFELEEGGTSSFFTEAHKVNVAKKVAKILELDEAQVLVHPDGDAIKQKTFVFNLSSDGAAVEADEPPDEAADASSQTTLSTPGKIKLENIKSGAFGKTPQISIQSVRRIVSLGLVSLVLVGLYLTKDNIIELVRPTPQPPKVEVTQEPVVEEAKPEAQQSQQPQQTQQSR